ncbi:Phage tail fibre repeat [Serratia proteamaculans]|uniref:phage tail protein n=1 Tax=Serratia proteamaculans TaxID=28151 RepID=UPI0021827808|nr:phage tail protein [Serratia proteamaculans]CAI2401600.1 Phage tail fibre repeat [Serratia proteamaculans]
MTAKFFAILTSQGAAKLANATALGTRVDLTHIAVGDGGGTLPTPDAAQTALKGEKRRAAINMLTIDPGNDSQIIAEQIIPENEGGWWIREIGLFSSDGTLIAVANCPETYKPQLQEGSGRTQTIRMVLIVSSTEAVTLKIDPSVVLATRQYVDDAIIEVKTYVEEAIKGHAESRNHPDATLKEKGFVQLSSATDSDSESEAATPKAIKAVSNPSGRLLNTRTFTTSGMYKPTAKAKFIRITLTGGGGGGGGCQSHNNTETFSGAGGGAGATVITKFELSGAASYPVTIGSGGAGRTGAANGGDGGASFFSSLFSAPGGGGGGKSGVSNTAGGGGGFATTGDICIPGGSGTDGQSGSVMMAGIGGCSYFGGGGRAGAGGGIGGSAPGSGGGGAYDTSFVGTMYKGGDGAPGIVIIEEFS